MLNNTFKKIRKFIFHPFQFFKDSWVINLLLIYKIKKYINLFVITHLGQLTQSEKLIKKEKLTDCVLIILYTNKNKKMPQLVLSNANKELFEDCIVLEIPLFPNKIELIKLIKINLIYKILISNIQPITLYLFSFERHYALLANQAKKLGCKINLVEEGTATYKHNNINHANKQQLEILTKKEKNIANLINRLSIFRDLRPSLSIVSEFDTIFSSFPKLLEPVFKCKNNKYFFLYEELQIIEKSIKIKEKYNIEKNDIIFLNQRYPFPKDIYANILIEILTVYTKKYQCKVFIKLHPKDPIELKNRLVHSISQNNEIKEKVILIDDYGFLVEELIALTTPKLVLSLASTSLIYTKLINKNIETNSIYPLIKSKLLENFTYQDDIFKEVESHFMILKKFNKTKIIYNNEDI